MRLHELLGQKDGELVYRVMQRKFDTDCGVLARDFLVALLDNWPCFLGGHIDARIEQFDPSMSSLVVVYWGGEAGAVWCTGKGWL